MFHATIYSSVPTNVPNGPTAHDVPRSVSSGHALCDSECHDPKSDTSVLGTLHAIIVQDAVILNLIRDVFSPQRCVQAATYGYGLAAVDASAPHKISPAASSRSACCLAVI